MPRTDAIVRRYGLHGLFRARRPATEEAARARELVSILPDPMNPFTGFLRPIVLEKKLTGDVEDDATSLARKARRQRGRKFMYVIFSPRAHRAP
jgi:hypothetical protein